MLFVGRLDWHAWNRIAVHGVCCMRHNSTELISWTTVIADQLDSLRHVITWRNGIVLHTGEGLNFCFEEVAGSYRMTEMQAWSEGYI